MTPLRHRTTGRSVKALATLALIWAALAGMWVGLQASPFLVGVLVLLTLPALWEFVTAKPSGLDLDTEQIRWFSGRHQGDVALRMIEHAGFDTRLDLSVRVTLHLHSGRKIRLPHDSLPDTDSLKAALEQAGVRTQTHHFRLFG